jgi:hypothetical protein
VSTAARQIAAIYRILQHPRLPVYLLIAVGTFEGNVGMKVLCAFSAPRLNVRQNIPSGLDRIMAI